MRKETVDAKNYYQAKKMMPWASVIVRADRANWEIAYMGFESIYDYKTWKNQK